MTEKQEMADLQRRVNDLFDALEQRGDKVYAALRCKIDRLIEAGNGLYACVDHYDMGNVPYLKAWDDEVARRALWTETDFCREWQKRKEKGERKGQAWFNTLYQFDPELADMIRGTAVDPFYKDHRVKVAHDLIFGTRH